MSSVLRGRAESSGAAMAYVATYRVDGDSVAWSARLEVGGALLVVSACEDLARGGEREPEDIVAAAIGRMVASLARASN